MAAASSKNGTAPQTLPRLMPASTNKEQQPRPSQQTELEVKLGYHWLIAGITGAGKTTLARELIKILARLAEAAGYLRWRLFVLDGLNVGDYDGFANHILSEEAPEVEHGGRVQVWHPLLESPVQIERWLRRIRETADKDEPTFVLINELEEVIYEKLGFSEEYRKLEKMGRGLKITMITLTQEASYIPRTAVGQASYIIRMFLGNEVDARKLDKRIRNTQGEPTTPYGFWFNWRGNRGPALFYRDMREFLGIGK